MSVSRHPNARRCTHVDENGVRCITLLCQLNFGPDCFIHSKPIERPSRAEQETVAFGEFEKLMRQQHDRIAA